MLSKANQTARLQDFYAGLARLGIPRPLFDLTLEDEFPAVAEALSGPVLLTGRKALRASHLVARRQIVQRQRPYRVNMAEDAGDAASVVRAVTNGVPTIVDAVDLLRPAQEDVVVRLHYAIQCALESESLLVFSAMTDPQSFLNGPSIKLVERIEL